KIVQVTSVVFFFSSRRRHTRWPRDWSSDVCSSDLGFQPFLKGLRSTADKNAYPVLPRGASTKDAAKMNAGLGGKLESFVEHAIADARGEKQKWFCGCFRSAAKKIESVLAAVQDRKS